MKLSVFADAFGCQFELALDYAVELGFERVNIRTRVGEDNMDSLPGCASSSVADAISNCGLSVNCIASTGVNPLLGGYGIFDPDHASRMEQMVERLARFADELDAATVRVYSLARPPGWDQLAPEEKDRILSHNAQCLSRYAEIAERHARTIVVENEPPTLTSTSEELADLCKRSGNPRLRVAWDPVNAWRAGQLPGATAAVDLTGLVEEVHVVGANPDPENPEQFGHFAIAGQDRFPHENVLRAIYETGFDGAVTVDPHYGALPRSQRLGGPRAVVEVVRRTKRFLESLDLP